MYGSQNSVNGSQSRVYGSHNSVYGSQSRVYGSQSSVYGAYINYGSVHSINSSRPNIYSSVQNVYAIPGFKVCCVVWINITNKPVYYCNMKVFFNYQRCVSITENKNYLLTLLIHISIVFCQTIKRHFLGQYKNFWSKENISLKNCITFYFTLLNYHFSSLLQRENNSRKNLSLPNQYFSRWLYI